MTSKLLAAATLMLVTTASAWAESSEAGSRLQNSRPDTVKIDPGAVQDDVARQDDLTVAGDTQTQ